MKIKYGEGRTEFGPGVSVHLTGDEVATAVMAYLVAHGVHVSGARTVFVNNELCTAGEVFVDPMGFIVAPEGTRYSGRGPRPTPSRKPA